MEDYAFTKLFKSITDSSIWCEDSDTRVVWVTMLSMMNYDFIVYASINGLAKRSAVSIEATEKAIAKFLAPDKYSRDKEFEGRRLKEVSGGWFVLNGPKFSKLRSSEERKAYQREWARDKYSRQNSTVLDSSRQSSTHIELDKEEDKDKKEDKNPPSAGTNHPIIEAGSETPSHCAAPSPSDSEPEQPDTRTGGRSGRGGGKAFAESASGKTTEQDFEVLWKAYPSKTGRQAASDAWKKWSKKGDTVEVALAGIERYKKHVAHRRATGFKDLNYQNGSTFFHQRGWMSEWETESTTQKKPTKEYADPNREDPA